MRQHQNKMPEVVIDTKTHGWDQYFERVTQTGEQTGNHEKENFVQSNVQYRDDGFAYLVLSREHDGQWTSGKIRSRKTLTEYAPNGGRLSMLVQGPNVQNNSRDGFCPAIWPALWLLSDGGQWPTGGEIDLFELMEFPGRPDTAHRAFSTLHFGPSRGRDYVFTNHWGLKLCDYPWNTGDKLFVFEWRRESGGAWRLSLALDGTQLWSFTTTRDDVFKDVEHRPGLNPEGFRPNQSGDPACIFRRAFDDKAFGHRLIVNLSLGGTPFSSVDPTLRVADFVVKHVHLEAY